MNFYAGGSGALVHDMNEFEATYYYKLFKVLQILFSCPTGRCLNPSNGWSQLAQLSGNSVRHQHVSCKKKTTIVGTH